MSKPQSQRPDSSASGDSIIDITPALNIDNLRQLVFANSIINFPDRGAARVQENGYLDRFTQAFSGMTNICAGAIPASLPFYAKLEKQFTNLGNALVIGIIACGSALNASFVVKSQQIYSKNNQLFKEMTDRFSDIIENVRSSQASEIDKANYFAALLSKLGIAEEQNLEDADLQKNILKNLEKDGVTSPHLYKLIFSNIAATSQIVSTLLAPIFMYKDEIDQDNPELAAATTSSLYVSSSLAAISHLVGFVASYADKSDLTVAGAAKLAAVVENLRGEESEIKRAARGGERGETLLPTSVAATGFARVAGQGRAIECDLEIYT